MQNSHGCNQNVACLVFSFERIHFHWYYVSITLRQKCPYSELFWSNFFGFGMNTERYGVSLRIQPECGKMRTRVTPNTDTLRSVFFPSLHVITFMYWTFSFYFFTLFINNWWHLLIPFVYSVKYVQFCSEIELVYEKNKL